MLFARNRSITHSCTFSAHRLAQPPGSHQRRRHRTTTSACVAEVVCGTGYIACAPVPSRMSSSYGRADLPPAEASGSRSASRTGFGTARWLSDGPFDPSNRAVSRSGITCRRTGTGDSAALTPCLGSRLPSAPVREGPIGWWDKSFVPPLGPPGQPGDPWDGSGRPARAQERPGRSRRGASCAMRISASLGLTPKRIPN